ncbi:phosphoenolpyruvate synthase, partial [cyanobacterium TDX16]
MTSSDVLDLGAVGRSRAAEVGGKGANLGELMRIDGVPVPPGFCVTTHAYRRVVAEAPAVVGTIDALASISPEDHEAIRTASADARRAIQQVSIPEDLASSIRAGLARFGDVASWAVRSSATAEDLPTASFAGQQDSYLGVIGAESVLEHVRRCWASLFTERAVAYRLHDGIDGTAVQMAVVIQQMVEPHAAGVLFTADPVSGNRTVSTVESTYGLGEAFVSGVAEADRFTVKGDQITSRAVAHKRTALRSSPSGG